MSISATRPVRVLKQEYDRGEKDAENVTRIIYQKFRSAIHRQGALNRSNQILNLNKNSFSEARPEAVDRHFFSLLILMNEMEFTEAERNRNDLDERRSCRRQGGRSRTNDDAKFMT